MESKNFIEEVFYGNIDPQEKSIKKNRRVRRELKMLSENEDWLLKELASESQKRFLEYVDAWGIVNGESTLDGFITGFRLGARFAYDTFVSDDAPFEDFSEGEINKEKPFCENTKRLFPYFFDLISCDEHLLSFLLAISLFVELSFVNLNKIIFRSLFSSFYICHLPYMKQSHP